MHKSKTPPYPPPPCHKDRLGHALLRRLVRVCRGTGNHLAQLVLLGELPAQLAQVGEERARRGDDGFFGGEGAVGLDAELDGGEEGVGDWGRGLGGVEGDRGEGDGPL